MFNLCYWSLSEAHCSLPKGSVFFIIRAVIPSNHNHPGIFFLSAQNRPFLSYGLCCYSVCMCKFMSECIFVQNSTLAPSRILETQSKNNCVSDHNHCDDCDNIYTVHHSLLYMRSHSLILFRPTHVQCQSTIKRHVSIGRGQHSNGRGWFGMINSVSFVPHGWTRDHYWSGEILVTIKH